MSLFELVIILTPVPNLIYLSTDGSVKLSTDSNFLKRCKVSSDQKYRLIVYLITNLIKNAKIVVTTGT